MREEELLRCMQLSEEIAASLQPPLFYTEKAAEVEMSRRIFEHDTQVRECLDIVAEYYDRLGHGLTHVRKVAVDAGALVLIEAAGRAGDELDNLVHLAHLAGTLHDVRRAEKDHAQKGAVEAALILADCELEDWEIQAVVVAIRNHEAFREIEAIDQPAARLISDSLYDADKFRWGPDNFTQTVWSMLAPFDIPLSILLDQFIPSLGGIERIKATFRTTTGQAYGPDFIDRGLEIGMHLYNQLVSEQTEE